MNRNQWTDSIEKYLLYYKFKHIKILYDPNEWTEQTSPIGIEVQLAVLVAHILLCAFDGWIDGRGFWQALGFDNLDNICSIIRCVLVLCFFFQLCLVESFWETKERESLRDAVIVPVGVGFFFLTLFWWLMAGQEYGKLQGPTSRMIFLRGWTAERIHVLMTSGLQYDQNQTHRLREMYLSLFLYVSASFLDALCSPQIVWQIGCFVLGIVLSRWAREDWKWQNQYGVTIWLVLAFSWAVWTHGTEGSLEIKAKPDSTHEVVNKVNDPKEVNDNKVKKVKKEEKVVPIIQKKEINNNPPPKKETQSEIVTLVKPMQTKMKKTMEKISDIILKKKYNIILAYHQARCRKDINDLTKATSFDSLSNKLDSLSKLLFLYKGKISKISNLKKEDISEALILIKTMIKSLDEWHIKEIDPKTKNFIKSYDTHLPQKTRNRETIEKRNKVRKQKELIICQRKAKAQGTDPKKCTPVIEIQSWSDVY